jgi:hypothetical protein
MSIISKKRETLYLCETSIKVDDGSPLKNMAVSGRVFKETKKFFWFKIKPKYKYQVVVPGITNELSKEDISAVDEACADVTLKCVQKFEEYNLRRG